jgi:hypothetical protein
MSGPVPVPGYAKSVIMEPGPPLGSQSGPSRPGHYTKRHYTKNQMVTARYVAPLTRTVFKPVKLMDQTQEP